MLIRPATAAELPALQDIERAAGEAFRALGMDTVADDEPPTVAELERFRRAGRAWVAADEAGAPLAYLLSEPLDEPAGSRCAYIEHIEHIEQVTVHPRAARRGIGRALIDRLADRALAEGRTALTLTTFTDVPWNAPYYARIGFRPLTEAELTPGLRRIRAHEAGLGLDRWPRLCLRRALTADPTADVTPRTAP
ncbi:GNAT family N-acetyltransferase [Streptomyces sp. NPDC017988]|uniref:GNAT family N-acetyltransferase n=1 Tax=Streptomyces sp. NPDC017988 TaxID=3365025 RepID=UPI00378F7FB4